MNNYNIIDEKRKQNFGQVERAYVRLYRPGKENMGEETFIRKLNTLRSEMIRTRSQMSNLASTIKYCAYRIQCEEREIEERAKTLKCGR